MDINTYNTAKRLQDGIEITMLCVLKTDSELERLLSALQNLKTEASNPKLPAKLYDGLEIGDAIAIKIAEIETTRTKIRLLEQTVDGHRKEFNEL